MKNQPRTFDSRALPRFLRAIYIAGLLPALVFLLNVQSLQAGSATWELNPASGDWNAADNWMPTTVPNGPADTAMFAFSHRTDLSVSASTEVNAIVFNPGSVGTKPFTITVSPTSTRRITKFIITGAGITNNTGEIENFVVAGALTEGGPRAEMFFLNNAAVHADNIHFTINGGSLLRAGSDLVFSDHASAGGSTFTVNGGSRNAEGGVLLFNRDSSAANATLVARPGVGNGGKIVFANAAGGGTARVQLFGSGGIHSRSDGFLDLTLARKHDGTPTALTIGSLEGDGVVFLAPTALRVGSNSENTLFSGLISDGYGFGSGSLVKIGRGKLVLQRPNTYSGGTTVKGGRLVVNNRGESGTGSGPVQVDGGKLAGKGMIAGAVTIGTSSGAGAALAPGYLHGVNRPGSLTVLSPLTFNSDAIYQMELSSSNVTADGVIALGITIKPGAQFTFSDISSGILTVGTVFTIIENAAATAIVGKFSNLSDGATFTSNGNTFKANYQGGDGNDLTLTVVP